MIKIDRIQDFTKFTAIFGEAPFNLNFKLDYFDEITLTL